MTELIQYENLTVAKQKFDLVFYISRPRSSNFSKVKRMLKKADGYMEHTETQEYCAFFNLNSDKIGLIKEIYYQICRWKTASVFLRGCSSMSLQDYDYWFICYLDSILSDSPNFCECIAPFYFQGEYFRQRVEDCFILPCKNKKYDTWGHIKDDSSFINQFKSQAFSGRGKYGLCPKFDMSKFEALKTRSQIEKEIIKEMANPCKGCSFTLDLGNILEKMISEEEEKVHISSIEKENKKSSKYWVLVIIFLILIMIFY